MKLVSVDDHLYEHRTVWSDRLPAKFSDRAPRVVRHDGRDHWEFNGRLGEQYLSGVGNAAMRRPFAHLRDEHTLAEEDMRGLFDPVARLECMDEDGVWAQLCFPTFPRFAGTRFLEPDDTEFALACLQAYNDFVLDEWCAAAPDRFIPLCIVPLWDVSLAAAEAVRVAEKGARSITFPEQTVPLGLPSIHTGHWDPLFAVAEEAQLPLSTHFGTSGVMPRPTEDGPDAVFVSLMGTNSMDTLAEFIFSDVFIKFPGLKIALSEGGIGWMPWLKERMDYTWQREGYANGVDRPIKPSELFETHVYGCFIDDEAGVEARHRIGVNNIMLESDYPHHDTSWPYTRKRAAEVLRDVPDDEAHRIAELNARELYRFP